MNWIIEQFDIIFGHKYVLPWLYDEEEARDGAISYNIHSNDYCYSARRGTPDEVAQIRSLIAASNRHAESLRKEVTA